MRRKDNGKSRRRSKCLVLKGFSEIDRSKDRAGVIVRGESRELGKALHTKHTNLSRVVGGSKNVSASIAFRVARFAKVGVDDVLTGKFPSPGTCPHCGHVEDEATQRAGAVE